MAEWVAAMTDGHGIVVFRRAFAELEPIEAANARFWAMIDEQRRNSSARGDHFAKPGANDRVWNALEKLCLADPKTFAAYYGNAIIALISEAWLGPFYQITSQLNVVNPGGEAQVPIAITPWASRRRAKSSAFRRMPIACRRCSPCKARSCIATCRSKPARRSICRSRRPTCRAIWRRCASVG